METNIMYINPSNVEVAVRHYYPGCSTGSSNEPGINAKDPSGYWSFNIQAEIKHFDGCYGEARWQAQVLAASMGIDRITFWN